MPEIDELEFLAESDLIVKLMNVMPITLIIISIMAVGAWITYILMKQHISSLKEFIEYLKVLKK